MASYFTTGNNLVIPKANASSISPAQMSAKVFLNVYDLHPYNAYLSPIGTGFYHSGAFYTCTNDKVFIRRLISSTFSGVEIGNGEYCFSMGGVSKIMPQTYDNGGSAKFKQKVLASHIITNAYDPNRHHT